jgi:asparagine synthase (glutamine-hydrolysing)
MCGITGFINANGSAVDRALLEKMNAAIIHRGPDDDGFYLRENVGLAMRRLSIIDLAGGKQPIHNQDKTAWLIFNGEIYNYQELRQDLENEGAQLYTKSDTEVVLQLYDRYGADCLQYLRGMFAFAIWDTRDESLFLARDRVGKKPLLYSHQPNGDIIFGSEFQALLKHPSISREVDYEAIHHYLSFICVPAPLTAYKQIRKLEPGHWLRWKNGEIETKRYWLPDFSEKLDISETEAQEEVLKILRESVRLRMIAEVPLGAFLSGGVDSSTVVALMAQESSRPVKTFSIGFEEQDFSELKYAKKVAEHVGAEYNEFIVKPNAMEVLPTLIDHYGEPYADPSSIPTYYVSKETRRHVTVALNGDGGDESFAGYERYVAMRLAKQYARIPAILRKPLIEFPLGLLPHPNGFRNRLRSAKRFVKAAALPHTVRYLNWVSGGTEELKTSLYTEDFQRATAGFYSGSFLQKWLDSPNAKGILDATLLTDQQTYLPNDLLVKVDIASMAVSLEARSPFLDHKLIEFAAKLPEKMKASGMETKSLLKKIAAKLVPKEVIYRRKMGFGVPVGYWMRNEMKDFVYEVLLSEKAAKRGIFKPEALKDLIELHMSGKEDLTFMLWTLLMLELWFQRFID